MQSEPLLKVVDVRKSFGKVEALKGVSFEVYPGEVVALLGDNGAGKSTLIKILMGIHQKDGGKIFFKGKEINFLSPSEAHAMGIEAVPQGGAVVPFLDIARNFFLGREPEKKWGPFRFLDIKKMDSEAAEAVRGIGVRVRSPRDKVNVLSGGERQAVSIARVLHFKSSLVLLDEPTLNLSVKETDKLLASVKELKKKGVAVIFVTHNVYHVYTIADKFIILDRGEMIGFYKKGEVDAETIIDTIRTGSRKTGMVRRDDE
ncbi:sugar ABC transporter ATP-binding protein [Candidatus Heimdallarchaeota archaeon]|nr:MAG: sugar ABC transporter ATP-binding protein [Candidatus Heimdallarchaeota archaeon]